MQHWPWQLRGPCLCVRVYVHLGNIISHHPPSHILFSSIGAQIFSPLSVSHEAVSSASSGPKVRRRRRKGEKKSGTSCSALSEISSSSLTFGFTHLIFLSDKVHKHTLQVEELGKLHTRTHSHTHSPRFGFLDEFKEGEGDMTSSLWSMELSLTLSVLVMSDESSQMGDFFFFHLERYWQW